MRRGLTHDYSLHTIERSGGHKAGVQMRYGADLAGFRHQFSTGSSLRRLLCQHQSVQVNSAERTLASSERVFRTMHLPL